MYRDVVSRAFGTGSRYYRGFGIVSFRFTAFHKKPFELIPNKFSFVKFFGTGYGFQLLFKSSDIVIYFQGCVEIFESIY